VDVYANADVQKILLAQVLGNKVVVASGLFPPASLSYVCAGMDVNFSTEMKIFRHMAAAAADVEFA
jgi:hypothetical protein